MSKLLFWLLYPFLWLFFKLIDWAMTQGDAGRHAYYSSLYGPFQSTEVLLEVDALQSRADRASDVGRWFLIVAVAAGAILGFATVALVTRSLISRRASRRAVSI